MPRTVPFCHHILLVVITLLIYCHQCLVASAFEFDFFQPGMLSGLAGFNNRFFKEHSPVHLPFLQSFSQQSTMPTSSFVPPLAVQQSSAQDEIFGSMPAFRNQFQQKPFQQEGETEVINPSGFDPTPPFAKAVGVVGRKLEDDNYKFVVQQLKPAESAAVGTDRILAGSSKVPPNHAVAIYDKDQSGNIVSTGLVLEPKIKKRFGRLPTAVPGSNSNEKSHWYTSKGRLKGDDASGSFDNQNQPTVNPFYAQQFFGTNQRPIAFTGLSNANFEKRPRPFQHQAMAVPHQPSNQLASSNAGYQAPVGQTAYEDDLIKNGFLGPSFDPIGESLSTQY